MFLPSDFYSSSLSCSFLSVLLSLLLSGHGRMQELSTTFQTFPPGWKQIPLSSSDISIAWVEFGKPLKNQFISTNHPKDWKLFEDHPKPQGLAFSPQSLRLFFSPKQLSFPSTSSVFFHLSSAAKANLPLPPVPMFHILFQKERRYSDVCA